MSSISYVSPTLSSNSLEARVMEQAMEAAILGDYEGFKNAFNSIMALGKKDKSGISIHSTCTAGMNLAHCAVLGNNVDILKMVHKAGVDLNARDAEGMKPLDIVADRLRRIDEWRREESENKLLQNFYYPNPVRAQLYVNPEILSYLKNNSVGRPTQVTGVLDGCSENITENPTKDVPLVGIKENIR